MSQTAQNKQQADATKRNGESHDDVDATIAELDALLALLVMDDKKQETAQKNGGEL